MLRRIGYLKMIENADDHINRMGNPFQKLINIGEAEISETYHEPESALSVSFE